MTTLNLNNIDINTSNDLDLTIEAPKKARKGKKAQAPVAESDAKAKKSRKSRKVQEAEASQASEELTNSIALEAWRKDESQLPETAPTIPQGWDSVDTSTEEPVMIPVLTARERVSAWLSKHNAETPIPVFVKVHRTDLLEWQIIDKKARKIGSDDMSAAALALQYGKEAGLKTSTRGEQSEADIATSLAGSLRESLSLSLSGNYEASMHLSYKCLQVARVNDAVGMLKVGCRDGKSRCVTEVIRWFAGNRAKVIDDIAFAREEQAVLDAELAAAAAAEQADAEEVVNHRVEVQVKVHEILAAAAKKRAA